MRIFKILIMLVFIMPFLFTVGIMASSADSLGPVSIGSYSIDTDRIVLFGDNLKNLTEKFVLMEIDLVRKTVVALKHIKHNDSNYSVFDFRELQKIKPGARQ
jgi:hypothetical protein